MIAFYIVLFLMAALAVLAAALGIRRVPEGNAQVVERFGRYHKTLMPGINFIVPGLDLVKRDIQMYTFLKDGAEHRSLADRWGNISTREEILDPGKFDTLASDNAVVFPDLICYFRIVDPAKAVYGVTNLGESLLKLLETTLRQEVGKLNSDTVIVSRDIIGAKIQETLERASGAWGTKIMRVEIQEIHFSDQVQENLTKAREAELIKRAQVVTASQDRDTEILRAEGKKRSAILMAEGQFEAAKLQADADYLLASRRLEGEAKGTLALSQALRESPEAVITLKALEAQKAVAESLGKSSNTMILPAETAGLFGAIGAVAKGLAIFNGNGHVSGNAAKSDGKISASLQPKPETRPINKPVAATPPAFPEVHTLPVVPVAKKPSTHESR